MEKRDVKEAKRDNKAEGDEGTSIKARAPHLLKASEIIHDGVPYGQLRAGLDEEACPIKMSGWALGQTKPI